MFTFDAIAGTLGCSRPLKKASKDEVDGNKAFFKKSILNKIKEFEAKPYIPFSAMVYGIDEENFSYNKDSNEWFCSQGNSTAVKKFYKDRREKEYFKYYLEKEKCSNCSLREDCIRDTNVRRILVVGINTPELYSYSQEQKTEEFKEKYK